MLFPASVTMIQAVAEPLERGVLLALAMNALGGLWNGCYLPGPVE